MAPVAGSHKESAAARIAGSGASGAFCMTLVDFAEADRNINLACMLFTCVAIMV